LNWFNGELFLVELTGVRAAHSLHNHAPLQPMQSAQFQLHAEIEQRHWWFVGRRQIVGSVVERLLPPSPETTIVDVGCGTGANLGELATRYDCVGIDTSAEAIVLARQRFPQVKFIHGFAPAGLGDIITRTRLVLLMDVLEHVEHDRQLLADLVDALQPGTLLLITVPANPKLWSPHDVAFGHYRRYELESLRELWSELPVNELMVTYFNARLYPLVRAARWLNSLRGQASGAAGTDFRVPPALVNHCLTRVFAGEASRLLRRSSHPIHRCYATGVSLMAVLRKKTPQGAVEPSSSPGLWAPLDAPAPILDAPLAATL
jgi:SAM-dependent methyltransferase